MANKFEHISTNAVVSLIQSENRIKMPHSSFLVYEFTQNLIRNLINNTELSSRWCQTGVEAVVLEPGHHWRKGKVRLTIEFCPDEEEPTAEPEAEDGEAADATSITDTETASPLDDIRQSMTTDEQ